MLLFRPPDYTRRPCRRALGTVTFTGPSGVRHSVEVTADSLYEAAALSLALFRKDGRTDVIGSGTELEVHVREPATKHTVTLEQVRRWCETVTVSPEETLKRRRVKELLST